MLMNYDKKINMFVEKCKRIIMVQSRQKES